MAAERASTPTERDRVVVEETPVRARTDTTRHTAGVDQVDVPIPEALTLAQDRVHWAAVWAGTLTAITTMMILNILGLALGLGAYEGAPREAGAQNLFAPSAARNAAIWAGIERIEQGFRFVACQNDMAFMVSGAATALKEIHGDADSGQRVARRRSSADPIAPRAPSSS